MYTYNIFAYLYFKSTKFLSLILPLPPLRSFSLVWLQFFVSRFLLFLFSPQSFYAADTRIYAFHATVLIVGLVSFRILLSFFFSHFIIHYFLTYPYLCDSPWSIIVTTSRMISRRRSASLSLPLPRISWWRIIRTIMKISTLFHPLALSLSFTSRLRSFSVFVFHAFWIAFKGTLYSELQISSARRGRAVFTPLLSSHRRRCCRSSSLLLLFFCFFFPPFA